MISSKLAVSAALTLAFATFAAAQQIQVQVDGTQVEFRNAQPQAINDHVFVPLRGVFEQMGASVNWDQNTRTVQATRDRTDIRLRIGNREASVNGSVVSMEVPAMIVNGTTMVPIRFVSEALGAEVGWSEQQQLVMITSSSRSGFQPNQNQGNRDRGAGQNQRQQQRHGMAHRGEVVPVTLNQTLSSLTSNRGDIFSATVVTRNQDFYGDFPRGTKVIGHVAAVHPKEGDRPALLDLSFDKLEFPNGTQVNIDGILTSLDGQHVVRDDRGHMVVRPNSKGEDERMVYAGYGAGAGLLVGVLGKKPIESKVLGGILGYIVGQVKQDQRKATNIRLNPGTELGVRIDREMSFGW